MGYRKGFVTILVVCLVSSSAADVTKALSPDDNKSNGNDVVPRMTEAKRETEPPKTTITEVPSFKKDDVSIGSVGMTTVTEDTGSVVMTTVTEASEENGGEGSTGSTTLTYGPLDGPATDAPETPVGVFTVPEPFEMYMNRILLSGHVLGFHDNLENALYSSLLSGRDIDPTRYELKVHAISTTYTMKRNGEAVTDVQYAVMYNGHVLQRLWVEHVLRYPEVHQKLHDNLESNGLREYQLAPEYRQSLAHRHRVALSVTCSLFAVVLIVVIVAIVTRRRPLSRTGKKGAGLKGPCVTPGRMSEKRRMFPMDNESGVVNPAYESPGVSVMDGEVVCP
ncbi:uncharacterized protein LOC128223428 [Mya arenaria]|uniref:uncharacterized protein LOC128223428 n=1 Tax=Mya arenaria TaxID=6604 RepID=UPI0022DF683D|nr:uncharacterized protein LOC128223428 [Mya arenaria]